MTAIPYITDIVDQHKENAASLWMIRDNAVGPSSFQLADLIRLDERIEANIDGLRIAEKSGWSGSLDELDKGEAGDFFLAGVLALESGDADRFNRIIELGYARAAAALDGLYHPAYDPWRGLVSALAWVDRTHVADTIERLLDTPRPRTRWLGVAACGVRRSVRQPGFEAALIDRDPRVRARAGRAVGELGRVDLRAALGGLLTEADQDCRFWGAWSAVRLGFAEGAGVLAEFTHCPGPLCDRALDILLRYLSLEDANSFIRPFARDPRRLRDVVNATGTIGDPVYVPWLILQTSDPAIARSAGRAVARITGADLVEQGLNGERPPDAGANGPDDTNHENVALDEVDWLPWPDPNKLRLWWEDSQAEFSVGTPYFLGVAKTSNDWISTLSLAQQHMRWAAALELALRSSHQAMFEVRARGARQAAQLKQPAT